MNSQKSLIAGGLAASVLLLGGHAAAFDLAELDGRTLRLDITARTVSQWHADNRNGSPIDDHYGDLFNRINFLLAYGQFVGSLRLDTATFGGSTFNPIQQAKKDIPLTDPDYDRSVQGKANDYRKTLGVRYRPQYVPAQFSLGFNSPNLEVTAGDSYVQFGRGIALSIRKQDELGFDTMLRGGKVVARTEVLSLTAVAGITNPTMVDVATGQSLYQMPRLDEDIAKNREGAVLFSPDQIYGVRAEAGSDGYTFGAHVVRMIRNSDASVEFHTTRPPLVRVPSTTISGLSGQMPLPAGLGSIYLEGDVQQNAFNDVEWVRRHGFALYGAVDLGSGPITGLIELQSYRSFDGLAASVNNTLADSFSALRYTAPPNTEPVDIDYRFGLFDRCVSGGRGRLDGRINKDLLLWGSLGYWATWSERTTAECQYSGDNEQRNDVVDGRGGLELRFDQGQSHLFASTGIRRDYAASSPSAQDKGGYLYYGEVFGKLEIEKHIVGRWATALHVRERRRVEGFGVNGAFHQGEVYASLRYTPDITATLGFEYTGDVSKAPTYVFGSASWQYRTGSSLQLWAGQMRGDLKCVNGVCRVFPDFSGVKLEWVQRY